MSIELCTVGLLEATPSNQSKLYPVEVSYLINNFKCFCLKNMSPACLAFSSHEHVNFTWGSIFAEIFMLFCDWSTEKTFAAFTSQCSIMVTRGSVPTDQAQIFIYLRLRYVGLHGPFHTILAFSWTKWSQWRQHYNCEMVLPILMSFIGNAVQWVLTYVQVCILQCSVSFLI